MADLFYWVLNMSILGSLLGLGLLALRRIRRLPRWVCYGLWAIVGLRLWLPVGLSWKWSLMNLLDGLMVKTVYLPVRGLDLAFANSIQAVNGYFPMTYRTNLLENLFATAGLIWAAVAAVAVLTLAFFYILTHLQLPPLTHIRGRVYRSGKAEGPMVLGIFRPKIILPEESAPFGNPYVLRHEETHIRRLDNLWRLTALASCCLHWFNPLMWVFLRAFLSDMELSCDEKVLKTFGESHKKEYALILVRCRESRTVYSAALGGAGIRARVERILNYRQLTTASGVALGLFVILCAVTLLTNGG